MATGHEGGTMQGEVTVTEAAGGVRVHTYTSPADGWRVNTHVVEGPEAVALFDAQLLDAYAEEAADVAAALGKPVERIVISHAHPDHWAGLAVLARRFPEAPVAALPGVTAAIEAAGAAMLAGLGRQFGDRITGQATLPTEALAAGPSTVAGVAVDLRVVRDAESSLQLAAVLPEARVLLAFDLVFPPGDHAFVTAPTFDHWIAVLDGLRSESGYDAILVGHDHAVDPAAYDATIDYLRQAKAVFGGTDGSAGHAAAVKSAFPQRARPERADFSGTRLFPVPAAG